MYTTNELNIKKNEFMSPYAYKNPTNIKTNQELYRSTYAIQRDQIIYTDYYRFLKNKTQVLSSSNIDKERTRLVHTMEVSTTAANISTALGCNVDMCEAIAVSHDIGHTPFGHTCEATLHRILQDKTDGALGFCHSTQSVRILQSPFLGDISTNHPISPIILEGVLKHDSDVYVNDDFLLLANNQIDTTNLHINDMPYLEAQIVFWSDKIAYIAHDTEDFITTKLFYSVYNDIINYKMLDEFLEFLTFMRIVVGLSTNTQLDDIQPHEDFDTFFSLNKSLIHLCDDYFSTKYRPSDLINTLTNNVIRTTNYNLTTNNIISAAHAIEHCNALYSNNRSNKNLSNRQAFLHSLLVNVDTETLDYYILLKSFLGKYYIHSSTVSNMHYKADILVSEMFEAYYRDINCLPIKFKKHILNNNTEYHKCRTISDYIAGMTDSYAIIKHNELFDI